jgi:hypothetical protein
MRAYFAAASLLVFSSGELLANEAYKQFSKLSAADQTFMLGATVRSVGDRCVPTASWFKGIDKSSDTAFYRVDCQGNRRYLVGIYADKDGSTKVLTCEFAKVVGVDCDAKW